MSQATEVSWQAGQGHKDSLFLIVYAVDPTVLVYVRNILRMLIIQTYGHRFHSSFEKLPMLALNS